MTNWIQTPSGAARHSETMRVALRADARHKQEETLSTFEKGRNCCATDHDAIRIFIVNAVLEVYIFPPPNRII